jgi:hypothetical protein
LNRKFYVTFNERNERDRYDNIDNIYISFHSGLATRGNILKLKHGVFKYDLVKYFFFTNKIVKVWNDLPHYVMTAKTINSFKRRLNTFWDVKKFFITGVTITGKQNSTLEPDKVSHS